MTVKEHVVPISDEQPLHTFPDRVFRESLEYPEHLRSLLRLVLPDLAEHFVVEEMRLLSPEFPADDWRGRQADLLYELPFRVDDVQQELVWVGVLVEHQSDTDRRMPLRTYVYSGFYWEKHWREWEQESAPREPFTIPPLIPIVFHTGPRPWGGPRRLTDILRGPEIFRTFVPNWEPLFWNLAERDVDALLASHDEWHQLLAIVRAEGAESEAFQRIFGRALRQIDSLHDRDRVRWYHLLRAIYTWGMWRRPVEDRDDLIRIAEESQTEADRKREIRTMGKTIAEALIEQGREQGRAEGREQERIESARRHVLIIGQRQLGPASEKVASALSAIGSAEQLESVLDRVMEAASWEELLSGPGKTE